MLELESQHKNLRSSKTAHPWNESIEKGPTIIHDFIFVIEMVPQTNPQAFDCVLHRSRRLHTQKQGYFYAKFHESEPGETWLGRGRSVGNVCHLSSDALPLSGTYQGDLSILKSLSSWSNLPPLSLWLWQPWPILTSYLSLQPFISLWIFSVKLLSRVGFLFALLFQK